MEAIDEALEMAGLRREDVAGIGVGSPGPIDPVKGVILFSSNLNVKDWPLAPDLAEAIGRPTLLRNDVRVGGYGEFRLGAGRGYKDVLAAFVGTGIGGCYILDGKVLEGATGNAGEIGHVVVKANGPMCGCGRRGCLEALASRSAIARRVGKAAKRGRGVGPGREGRQEVGQAQERRPRRRRARRRRGRPPRGRARRALPRAWGSGG